MGTKAIEPFALSDVYCSLYPSGADMAMIDIWNHHPWRYPLWRNLSDSQTLRVVGPADKQMDALAPSPLHGSL